MPRQTAKPPRGLKKKPLRQAGHSLREQRDELLYDKSMPLVVGVAAGPVMIALEWWRWYAKTPPSPIGTTVILGAITLFCGYRLVGNVRRLRNMNIGLEGEIAVGQMLDQLPRAEGFRVVHDVPGKNFNIDHVVVSPHGIFTIETKTHSKTGRGTPKVVVEGDRVLVDGYAPDRDPIAQGKAQAAWLKELLREMTGMTLPVYSMVVYPEWFVECRTRRRPEDVMVLNPKGIESFVRGIPPSIRPQDVELVVSRLALHVRGASE